MRSLILNKFTVGLLLSTLVACAESEFTSQSNARSPDLAKESEATKESGEEPADGSTTGESSGEVRLVEDEFETEVVITPVDVLFGVDTSGSMNEERASIEANMASFMEKLSAANIDARVMVMGTGFKFPTNLPKDKFAVVAKGIGSFDVIARLTEFLQAGVFPLQLRSEANLEVIIVTDDNGRGAKNLAKDFASIPGKKTIVNAIVGLVAGWSKTNPQCNIPSVGTEHMTLAKNTGGQVYDLCEKDWSLLFKKISESVIKNSAKPMVLKHAPVEGGKIEVKLDGVIVPASGYEVGADGRSVIFKMPIEKQSKIIISYETKE